MFLGVSGIILLLKGYNLYETYKILYAYSLLFQIKFLRSAPMPLVQSPCAAWARSLTEETVPTTKKGLHPQSATSPVIFLPGH